MEPRVDSLVLYKAQPAVVRGAADKKLTIELPDGQRLSVRPKDVALLHPGPAADPRRLPAPSGDPLTAWELLDSGHTTLPELAELAFGAYTPATAWAAWQLVADGLHFSGTPEAIAVHTASKVAETLATREAKAAEERAWVAFAARAAAGTTAPEDAPYLADVITLALDKSETSRTLRRLDKPQTREAAHAFLLAAGHWTPATNPYPARLNVPTDRPDIPVGPLPDEPRRDLTHLLALAIDDEGSSDPDDALSFADGVLWVHIADAAALAPPNSPADLEARARAANLYLPEGTVRMLPEEMTDWLALGLQEVSPALSLAFATDGDAPQLLEVVLSWVRVTRTTYEAAEARLDETPYCELMALAERSRARRVANGAVEIDLPEAKVRVGEDGLVRIKPLPPLRSRDLVREAMLTAGEALGRLAQEKGIPLIYTQQDPPSEMLLPTDGSAGPSAMFAQRRAMQRSQQRTAPGRHAGLGLDVYAQATSPLRRYGDLLAHQQLRAHLRGEPPLDASEVTLRLGTADAVAGAVRSAERLSNAHWTMVYLLQNPDWTGEGVVVEQKPGRDVVLIPALAWEAELYSRRPRALDSTVRLALDSVDLPNRSARFRVADH
jgi:exoribonuclease-2